MLKSVVISVLRLLVVVEPMGQIEVCLYTSEACLHAHIAHTNQICTGLPKITEDAVTQLSRDKHEDLADSYSIAVEDIPPMNWKHATAVGLHVALPLLRSNGKKGSGNEDLCQMMRSHIASHLTDYERTQYLQ